MRLLRRSLMIAVLAAGLVPSAAFAQSADIPIMPLSDVKPGMHGVGYSVFSGTEPEAFDFVVRGIVPDYQINKVEVWPWVITVQLSGGPKRSDGSMLFDKNLIYAGMSGSPMFIDGKLIGGLMASQDFNTAAQAAVTPIELQAGLIALDHPGETHPLTVRPGEYVATCFVYGDADSCAQSTVTAPYHEHLLTTSHSLDGMPYGLIKLPVFILPVADLTESQQGASKQGGKVGRPVGTAVVHGMFGMVVREGPLPETVPVEFTAAGIYERPQVLHYHMAYHKTATGALNNVLNTALARLPIDQAFAGLEVTIRLAQPAGTIRYRDSAVAALGAMEYLLDSLIDQEQESLRIDGIDIAYRRLPSRDLWSPLAVQIQGAKPDGKVTFLARRSRDNAVEQATKVLDTSVLRAHRPTPTWMDGTNAQGEILKVMSVRDALPLLAKIEDRDALYYISIEKDEQLDIDAKASGDVRRKPKVEILLTLAGGEKRFNATAEAKVRTLQK